MSMMTLRALRAAASDTAATAARARACARARTRGWRAGSRVVARAYGD